MNSFQLSVPGEHNITNSLAAIATCTELHVAIEVIKQTLEAFTGTHRRFDIIGNTESGLMIVDDYAHHPTEINATLSAAKNVPHKKLWCLFQPHTYTRTRALFNEFSEALCAADVIILAEIYAAREKNIYKISSKSLVEDIKKKHPEKDVYFIPDFDLMAKFTLDNAQDGDMIITMGAGDIYRVGEMILELNKK